ncbi:MAG: hypothetical protein DWP95_09720 [Proteobacteria bacterium]|nr:MAG: hypothetical protein DWP95_09720 [Pseudomonadota bacterium]
MQCPMVVLINILRYITIITNEIILIVSEKRCKMAKNIKANNRIKQTALVSALLLELTGAQGATIIVDGTTCSFADAVVAANTDTATGGCSAGAGADILELTSPVINVTARADIESDVTINGNGATIQSNGSYFMMLSVGYYSSGKLTLNDTTVQGGYHPYNWGAGVRAYNGSLNINRSTFTNNTGGAVLFSPGTSGSIKQSTISDNQGANADWYSGAISISGANVTIEDSTISNNSTISTSSGGGGLYITDYLSPLQLTISNTTISGNTAEKYGGGICHEDSGNGSTVVLNNVTLINNHSNTYTGGLYNDSANMTINQSLISGNTATEPAGTEIYLFGSGQIDVNNYNIIGLNSNAGVAGVSLGASDIIPTETSLTDIVDVNLANNGGMTPTHNLNPTGPAVDVIPSAFCQLTHDQTGIARPIDGNNNGTTECDVGAVEFYVDIIFKDGFD